MHNQVNEKDAPNTIAIYVVLSITLITLIVTFYGLSEYRSWLDMKRNEETNAKPFAKREAREKAEAANLTIIKKTLKEAKQEDFNGL